MNFGENLKHLRRKRDWKKSELAEKCGVSKETVSAWEKGKAEPTVTELIALSKVFDKTVDEIIGSNEVIGKKREKFFKEVCNNFAMIMSDSWQDRALQIILGKECIRRILH